MDQMSPTQLTAMAERLLIEIDGLDVRPDNLDAAAALTIAAAYVRLVSEIAEDDGVDLKFTKLEIVDKCVAFSLLPNEPDVALHSAKKAVSYVSGAEQPSKGTITSTRAVREALHRLPSGQTARVIAGPWKAALSLSAGAAIAPARETLAVRATPLRVGGTRPAVRFDSASEEKPFTLYVTREQARAVGPSLYRPCDIVAIVSRDDDGHVDHGELLEFIAVTDDDATTAWRSWYQNHAQEWDRIPDVEEELGRHHD
jgi:hypothetical protein